MNMSSMRSFEKTTDFRQDKEREGTQADSARIGQKFEN
jgi:hypothetical protein